MTEATFPKPAAEVVATLADIFRHQGRTELVEVCEHAEARFDETDFDNLDGGTYTWALRLEIPVSSYASLDSRLNAIEQEIGRQYPNNNLGEVTISPSTAGASNRGRRMEPSEIDVRRLWPDGRFKRFAPPSAATLADQPPETP
ncbi:MAG: hypothetical protein LBK99_13075 [Opitutaceae bacterium]|jgi:hypothetical protein|nr:hypothetical protein [Opitutaceae bacterium]